MSISAEHRNSCWERTTRRNATIAAPRTGRACADGSSGDAAEYRRSAGQVVVMFSVPIVWLRTVLYGDYNLLQERRLRRLEVVAIVVQ